MAANTFACPEGTCVDVGDDSAGNRRRQPSASLVGAALGSRASHRDLRGHGSICLVFPPNMRSLGISQRRSLDEESSIGSGQRVAGSLSGTEYRNNFRNQVLWRKWLAKEIDLFLRNSVTLEDFVGIARRKDHFHVRKHLL